MFKIIINLFSVIFLDEFYFTLMIAIMSVLPLALRKFFCFNIPHHLAVLNWFSLVALAGIVGVILAIEFFSRDKGMERLTLMPLIIGASPLFASALVALFLLPEKDKTPTR